MKNIKDSDPRSSIVIALDGPWGAAQAWLTRLKGRIWGFKVGSILYAERGPKVIEDILEAGHRVFLDLKFHDIPNTVQHATRTAFSRGVSLLTIHASGGRAMCEAAAAEQGSSDRRVLAVTVLTSFEKSDLESLGISRPVPDQVSALANLAVDSGVRGLVCSVQEVQSLRSQFPSTYLVTPGIRVAGANIQDQKRVDTFGSALRLGSDLAVVGRALTGEENWEAAWQKIICSTDAKS